MRTNLTVGAFLLITSCGGDDVGSSGGGPTDAAVAPTPDGTSTPAGGACVSIDPPPFAGGRGAVRDDAPGSWQVWPQAGGAGC